jgi:hypothetical protein
MTADGPRRLIAALLGPGEPELTCDECFDELGRYVDLQLAGIEADRAVPGMRAHLAGCPACQEDHASLAAFVAARGGDGAPPAAHG